VREFAALATRHELSRFMVVDNILDLDYFKTVLPRLPSTGRGGYRIFYETKANLRRPQVALLRQAGVTWIQPGIESLSDRLLKLTGKGTTALINTRLLKWAREEGLYTFWNILVDIPEEADADYREIAALIPAIVHLQPPKAIKPIQVVRFSGYHENPERYGLRLAPAWPYRYIYPLEERELADLCYNFDVPGKRRLQQTQAATPTTDDPFRAGSGVAACHQAVVEWQRLHASPSKPLLCIEPRAGEALILDTRPVAALRLTTISALEAAILDFCDEGAPFASIEQRFAHATAPAAEPSAAPSSSPSGEAFSAAFRRLVERRWLVPLSGQYLALPLQGNVPSLPENRHFPGGCLARAGERGCATIP
jgi:magnesium-protoporphyrin IX monomethyl ester (oxidative) cyclase